MIISRTPLRVSLCGGGSDLPAFYRTEPGAVLSTAIDKSIYITVNQKFDSKIRASYSKTEIVDHVDQLQHELIRESLRTVGIDGGIEITSVSDIPSEGTGLGSSSSYTVGLLNALYAFKGRLVGASRLAGEACQIELERCAKPIGKQDQWIAAHGGLQFIRFNPDESVFIDPVICGANTRLLLQEHLLMLYTGLTRSAEHILRKQSAETQKEPAVRALLRRMVGLGIEMKDSLENDRLDDFGKLLHASWLLKRELAPGVTNQIIDDWYERARRNGAIGGKILGAGGGGFLLLYVPPEHHERVIASLPELKPMPFRFEPRGSRIIFIEE